MEISHESWQALIEGQVRDAHYIERLQNRLERMARQVEKLSWMVEWLSDNGLYVEDAEEAWLEHTESL